MFTTVVLAVL